jgi:hypothetical protein
VISDGNKSSDLNLNPIQRAWTNHLTKAQSLVVFLDERIFALQQLKLKKKKKKKKKKITKKITKKK